MRKVYKDILSKADIDYIEGLKENNSINIGSNPPVFLSKIISELSKDFDFSIHKKSYWRIEKAPKGHPWHVDTGTNNHMSWCRVGCTILLDGEFKGGETLYRKDGVEDIVERNRYELLAHTSDEEHMVNPSNGERKVLLIFI